MPCFSGNKFKCSLNVESRQSHLISRSRLPIIVILGLRYDGWKNGHIPADMLTWRGLNNSLHGKGSCDYFLGQMELREYLFNRVAPFITQSANFQG